MNKTNSDPDKAVNQTYHFLVTFLAGGTSASLAVTAMAPLERIKLILQAQRNATHIPAEKKYKGIIDCFARIPKEQGVMSFWRGNVASIIRCFPYQALNFSLKELIKEHFIPKKSSLWVRLGGNVVAGGTAGCVALSIIYPLDFARTKLALDIGTKQARQYHGVWHCIKCTYQQSGFQSLYRGFTFSLLGVFIYRAIYFGLFDTIMECIRPEYSHSIWIEFPAAELSATAGGFVSYPFDTVRRQMMVERLDCSETDQQKGNKNRNKVRSMDIWRKIYKTEGVRGFFHGALTNVFRGTGGAIMLVLYDNIQRWMLKGHPLLEKHLHIKPVNPEFKEADFDFHNYFNKPPCKVFKDRCVFCNF